jgi:hypothetical protein
MAEQRRLGTSRLVSKAPKQTEEHVVSRKDFKALGDTPKAKSARGWQVSQEGSEMIDEDPGRGLDAD